MYINVHSDDVLVKGTLVQMIEFIIDSSVIGHPYEMTIVKLKFCENFKRIHLSLKLTTFDTFARADILLPNFHNTYSLKFRFLG